MVCRTSSSLNTPLGLSTGQNCQGCAQHRQERRYRTFAGCVHQGQGGPVQQHTGLSRPPKGWGRALCLCIEWTALTGVAEKCWKKYSHPHPSARCPQQPRQVTPVGHRQVMLAACFRGLHRPLCDGYGMRRLTQICTRIFYLHLCYRRKLSTITEVPLIIKYIIKWLPTPFYTHGTSGFI